MRVLVRSYPERAKSRLQSVSCRGEKPELIEELGLNLMQCIETGRSSIERIFLSRGDGIEETAVSIGRKKVESERRVGAEETRLD